MRRTSTVRGSGRCRAHFWILGWLLAAAISTSAQSATAKEYYLSPSGNDAAAGTSRSTAWRTFGRVFNTSRLIQPGDSLVLLSGRYRKTTTGLPDIDCTTNARNGTASAQITLRADVERGAFLDSDGSVPALRLWNCSYWNVVGVRAKSADLPANAGGTGAYVIELRDSSHIDLKRSLATHNNRYFNTHLIGWFKSNHVLLEENEGYFFHRHAFSGKGHHITVRRCYANSRHWADLPDGRPSHSNARDEGDEGITFYWGSDSIAENDIIEHAEGIQATGKRNRLLGNITIDGDFGFRFASNCQDSGTVQRCQANMSTYAEDNYGENLIALRPDIAGLDCDGADACVWKNVTVVGAGVWNVIGRDRLDEVGAPGYNTSMTATNVLSLGGARGIHVAKSPEPPTSWLVEYSNAHGASLSDYAPASENLADGTGNQRYSLSVPVPSTGVAAGQCIAWVPQGSGMKGAGEKGDDIGANVLYQYQDGQLTQKPLWLESVDGGRFAGCGAIIPGVNDKAGDSCFDVHKRLNINHNGCPFPAGYGGAAPTCADADADGYGSPASSACTYPELDCDDTDSTVNPGSDEQCGDNVDNDCNGFPDDGCGEAAFVCKEAETGVVVAPMATGVDPTASAETFVWLPDTDSINDDGSVSVSFDVPQAGTYALWARVMAPSSSTDSFYVSENGADRDVWHVLYGGEQSSTWTWDRVSAQGAGTALSPEKDPRLFVLEAGVQEILFGGRERGAKLDRLVLTQDPDYVPEGLGECPSKPEECVLVDGVENCGGKTAMAVNVQDIVVDGNLNDCGWLDIPWESFDDMARSDNAVEFATAWDPTHLYVGFKVTDAQLESDAAGIWQNDGVEIFLDSLHNATSTTDADDFHVILDIASNSTHSDVRVGFSPTSTGYTMEIGIPWSILGLTPSASMVLGILVGNNDRDMGSGTQFDWNGLASSGSYSRPNLWGDLVLGSTISQACDESPSVPPPEAPSACAEVTTCIDNDGCCPRDCLGRDLDCSLTGTVSCTDDGKGGKVCSVNDTVGCNTTGSSLPWAFLLLSTGLGISTLLRRKHASSRTL